jgi:hypothetical protein
MKNTLFRKILLAWNVKRIFKMPIFFYWWWKPVCQTFSAPPAPLFAPPFCRCRLQPVRAAAPAPRPPPQATIAPLRSRDRVPSSAVSIHLPCPSLRRRPIPGPDERSVDSSAIRINERLASVCDRSAAHWCGSHCLCCRPPLIPIRVFRNSGPWLVRRID